MNRTAMQAFAQRATGERAALFGQTVKYGATTMTMALSAVTQTRQIEAGGFEVRPDFIARVSTTAYPAFKPRLGQLLTVDGKAYKIIEIAAVTPAGELRLALGKA